MARQQRGAAKPGMVRVMGAVLLVAASFLWVGNAHGATISAPGLNATVTSTISPTRLPKTGSAPVSLSAKGTLTATDGLFHPVKDVELRLDRQFDIATTGLGTCTQAALSGLVIQRAQKRCGTALVGSGHLTEEFSFLGEQIFYRPAELLFFNTAGGGLLVYTFLPRGAYGGLESPAAMTARGTVAARSLDIPLSNRAIGGATVAFQFRFGRTWRHHGEKRSYLNGSCVSGQFSNRIVLTLESGERAMGSLPQECTREAQ